jgi:PH domain
MDSKKLQAFQQANSHMAPQTKPPSMQHYHDIRPTRSPVFQNHPQYQSLASNFAQINLTNNPHDAIQKTQGLQHMSHLEYQDQIFNPAIPEKLYHNQLRLGSNFPGVHQHQQASSLRLQQQFHVLEQEKIQQQIKTQNDALMHQQHTFAMRQQVNPPVSNFPMKSQTSSISNMSSLNNVPQHLQKILLHNRAHPPSSLNLNLSASYETSPQTPSKLNNNNNNNNNNNIQMQQIQMLQNERQRVQQIQFQSVQKALQHSQQLQKCPNSVVTPSDVPMIQQNIPGQVVNQAVQTQLTGSSIKSKSPESSSTTPSTPATPTHISSSSAERRKNEPVHSLKSPVAKRHPNAPVTLSGWLWKQGSEGLKVWRKRWFVLSEYCLFYYKSPEEERIMGSVLLPSYKISVCTPDDKSNRKFSFKCEHINMRTYILAAENLEFMAQWVKGLTMASMMQGSSESESQPSITSFNPSGKSFGENSADSGIQTFQSHYNKSSNVGPVTPASDNSIQNYQPLYANAPPKPRRMTDYGYSSPSPENAFDQLNQINMRQDAYAHKVASSSVPIGKTSNAALMHRMQQLQLERNIQSSENVPSNYSTKQRNMYEQDQYMQKLIMHQQQLQQQQKYMESLASLNNNNRMQQNVVENKSLTYKAPVDYEDIYNMRKVQENSQKLFDGYKRPLSPSLKNDSHNSVPFNNLNYLEQPSATFNKPIRERQSLNLTRPHSADFLEYEARNPVVSRRVSEFSQVPRPKSSLDINRTPDNAYYSESNYAEKMRQSALYLQQKQNYTMPLGKTFSQRVESKIKCKKHFFPPDY